MCSSKPLRGGPSGSPLFASPTCEGAAVTVTVPLDHTSALHTWARPSSIAQSKGSTGGACRTRERPGQGRSHASPVAAPAPPPKPPAPRGASHRTLPRAVLRARAADRLQVGVARTRRAGGATTSTPARAAARSPPARELGRRAVALPAEPGAAVAAAGLRDGRWRAHTRRGGARHSMRRVFRGGQAPAWAEQSGHR